MADATFGLEDVKIAVYNSSGSYGTAQDVWAVSQLQINEQTTNAELNGDDQTVEAHAKARVWQITCQFAFRDPEVFEIMTGAVLSDSYLSSDWMLEFGPRNYPYFGLCGKTDETNASACKHLWIPKVKVMQGFTLNFQYGQFVTPQLTMEAVSDNLYKGYRVYRYPTLKTVVIPPD